MISYPNRYQAIIIIIYVSCFLPVKMTWTCFCLSLSLLYCFFNEDMSNATFSLSDSKLGVGCLLFLLDLLSIRIQNTSLLKYFTSGICDLIGRVQYIFILRFVLRSSFRSLFAVTTEDLPSTSSSLSVSSMSDSV